MTLAQAPKALQAAVRATLGPTSDSSLSPKQKLTASDGAMNDQFGLSVAISGSTALVGAFEKNSGTVAAYVFVQSGSTWSQQAELTDSPGAINDSFGVSVAVSGSTALVGAYGKNSSRWRKVSGGEEGPAALVAPGTN